jgi:ATP-dependent DNA helicase RecQ
MAMLDELLDAERGTSIVYCATVKAVDALFDRLDVMREGVAKYHAQMPDGAREESRHKLMDGRARIMIATKAFGMGVDKKDVRTVIHTQLPDSIESYVQRDALVPASRAHFA